MNVRKVDVETSGDWGFLSNADLMTQMRRLVRSLARQPDDYDDLLCEAEMYLAVRPQKQLMSSRRIVLDVKKYLSRIIRKNDQEILVGDFEKFMEVENG